MMAAVAVLVVCDKHSLEAFIFSVISRTAHPQYSQFDNSFVSGATAESCGRMQLQVSFNQPNGKSQGSVTDFTPISGVVTLSFDNETEISAILISIKGEEKSEY
jgi:hypothetical protein